ncbi:hypothetical protein HFO56_33645 [Rhizobium laguerreae]|uniref:hypothetical protein n=1 Tax=Rhizobium laguerreae TaxID=1076926 RepID=UPI001C913CC0|nr:hypothetical protein [Rhizobium laguerreae]MBY3157271.1 hypothetical protein [Rhizobium laguerreae]
MRFTFNHPAVVTGTWENGHVRRELVRVAADFEIAEYSSAEAPLTFEVRDQTSNETSLRIRTVGGRHYKRWRWDEPSTIFGTDSQFLRSLYNGRELEFSGIERLVDAEITRVKSFDHYRSIENTERRPFKREEEAGLGPLSVSCMKAPMLKNWQWLGPDAATEVADWRDRTAAILGNVAFVDGIPHVRTFEPCYRVSHAPLGSSRKGVIVSVDNASFYAKEPDRTVVDPATGFEILGKNALMIGLHNFAPTEFHDLRSFCLECGWGFDDRPRQEIVTHDPSAVGLDYLEMETVRHARMLHDRAGQMIKLVVLRDGAEVFCGQPVDTHILQAQMDALRISLLSWQSDRNGTDKLAAPFEDLLEHVLHWEEARPTKATFDISDQMASFKVREDMSPVVVAPIAGATP